MNFNKVYSILNEKVEKAPYKFKMKIQPGFKHLHGDNYERMTKIYKQCYKEIEEKIKEKKMKAKEKHGWDTWALWSSSDKYILEDVEKKYLKEWRKLKKEGSESLAKDDKMSNDHKMVVDFFKHQKKHGLKI